MTFDAGVKLRDFSVSLVKTADYRTQSGVIRHALRLMPDLLAEGNYRDIGKPGNKDAFLIIVTARTADERD